MARKITAARLMRRDRRFYTGYFIALALFAMLVLAACSLIKDVLREYESTQPEHAAEAAARMFAEHDYAAMYAWEDEAYLSGADLSEYSAFMAEHIGGMEITWKKKITADETNVTYAVYADGKRFGAFLLAPGETTRWGFTGYVLADAQTTIFLPTPEEEPVTDSIRIRCDARSTVSVNGTVLGEDAIVESNLPTFAQGHMPQGVAAPVDVIYETTIQGEPQITVTDHQGREQAVELTDGMYVAQIHYEDEQMRESREPWIFQLAQVISRYTTNNASINTLLNRMEENSRAHQYLAQYNSDYVKDHYGFDFANMQSRNYLSYSEDCFSVEVQYEYIVHFYAADKTYESAYRFYFRKIDDRWMLYDFDTLKYE